METFDTLDELTVGDMEDKPETKTDMNILILGETGVGKSTWINGFINFLIYESLQDAENNELMTLIASKFTICDDEYNEITVSTGTDSNEVQSAGQSATQECKIYPFDVNGRTIRLIDTPGIGDTRGVDQDKRNFENILTTLSTLKELHGICILLKPNNARLTVMFRFCIKELLTYLHKDASQNIMFCFTNSRRTFYRPGDTLPALKTLLQKNNGVKIPIKSETIYCFDSEAYRFLAAVKNKNPPVKFHPDERENFVKSWEKSIKETMRMLAHISSLKPHPTQSTLNLNHARQLVIKLTRPLSEISKNIKTIQQVIKRHVREIEATNDSIKDLQNKVMYDKPDLKITKLDYPRTVCTNSKCIKIYGKEIKQRKYITICHDHCGLARSVAADTVGHPGLIHCAAMSNNFCTVCGHGYQEHLHCYYDSEEIMTKVVNEAVQAMINQNYSAADVKKKMITDLEQESREYDYESKEIEKASVKFACFLKHNAITPYNDAMLEYMEHLIREEQGKVNFGGSNETLESMKKSSESYRKEIEMLDKEIKKSDDTNVLNPSEINILVDKLSQLKHNGKILHDALTAVTETSQKAALQQQVVHYKHPTQMKKSNWTFNFNPFKRII